MTVIEVYTTRPDTLMGASLLASPPTIRSPSSLRKTTRDARRSTEMPQRWHHRGRIETAEKLGFDTGLRVRHPFDTPWELPVYIANFIMMDYGTGAIFGCPAHDERDFEFATKYDLPIISTYLPSEDARPKLTEAYVPAKTEKVFYNGGSQASSGRLAMRRSNAAIDFCEAERRRPRRHQIPPARLGPVPPTLLGCPIPVVHCIACGVVPEKEREPARRTALMM